MFYIIGMQERKIESLIKDCARSSGFDLVGICAADSGDLAARLNEWLDRSYQGEMKYMENPSRRDPESVLPSVRTIIVVGLNYRWADSSEGEQEAMISKYAWGADYHRVMKPMLQSFSEQIQTLLPANHFRPYVDTGPVVEKHWAQKAGLGWIGKHTNVLNMQGSSWFFLGVVLTDAELPTDIPAEDHCGTCSLCIEACPTGAIVEPYVLDARLCISYLTIELRGSIPRKLRPAIGHRIFGCDDCQDVCPWNRFAHAGDPRFTPRSEILSATLRDYLRLTPEEFRQRFAQTNVLRAKYRGFLRNCLVAAGNLRKSELKIEIERHLNAEDEMIREHAVWALAQFPDAEVKSLLRQLRERESSPLVLEELNHWLS